jgi:hypothetical protein
MAPDRPSAKPGTAWEANNTLPIGHGAGMLITFSQV